MKNKGSIEPVFLVIGVILVLFLMIGFILDYVDSPVKVYLIQMIQLNPTAMIIIAVMVVLSIIATLGFLFIGGSTHG